MNKLHARKISETIPDVAIFNMLERAKTEVKDWSVPCKVNGQISRGHFWNMFACQLKAPDFEIVSSMVKYSLIYEFGDLLPKEYQPPKKKKGKELPLNYIHSEPKFN